MKNISTFLMILLLKSIILQESGCFVFCYDWWPLLKIKFHSISALDIPKVRLKPVIWRLFNSSNGIYCIHSVRIYFEGHSKMLQFSWRTCISLFFIKTFQSTTSSEYFSESLTSIKLQRGLIEVISIGKLYLFKTFFIPLVCTSKFVFFKYGSCWVWS